MKKGVVFLGGTAGNNDWRDGFIQRMVDAGLPAEKFFNPVVKDWNEEAQKKEEQAKKESYFHVYYLGDPKQPGNSVSFYSGIEAAMALYDRPGSTVVIFDSTGMKEQFVKAMNQAARVLAARHPNGHIFTSLDDAEKWLIKELK